MTNDPTSENAATGDAGSEVERLLTQLVSLIHDEVSEFSGSWDGFNVAFTFAAGLEGTALQQVDPIFYVESGAFTHGVFSRSRLEDAAVAYINARAGKKFDLAMLFVMFTKTQGDVVARVFWEQDAVPLLITPDSWASVAQAANPYREKKV